MNKGEHFAKATDMKWGETKNGNCYIDVTFEVTDGTYAGETIQWQGYFTEKTAESTIKALRKMGWAGDVLSKLSAADLKSKVTIVVDEEVSDKGYKRMRVRWVNGSGFSVTALPQGKLETLSKAMAGVIRKCSAPKPADDDDFKNRF